MCFCGTTDRGLFTHAPITRPNLDGWAHCTVCGRASEWTCRHCGDSYGSNLRGEAPFHAASVHAKRCRRPQVDPCDPASFRGRVIPGHRRCAGTKYPDSRSVRCVLANLDASFCDDASTYPYRREAP